MKGIDITPGVPIPADELVKRFTPLIERIARKIGSETRHLVERDDLIQCGYVAMLEAVDRYDHGQNCTLKTFLGNRIRGAMLDEIRRMDIASRGGA